MCGIAGMFDRSGRKTASEAALRQMLGMLRHRGPDEFGIMLDHEAGLGSARLSIIDLAGGSQPIPNEDETLWVVFNGEIFNYIELRSELEAAGHRFRTSSDTEVVVHLFEEHGPGCVSKMNGQFAIAIWDRERRRLFLARDRLGVRPLFYTQFTDKRLLFASEIKAIFSDPSVSRELDNSGVEEVFRFWAPLPAHTVFKGISELPPGHFLTADRDGVSLEKYWDADFAEDEKWTESPRCFEQAVDDFRQLLIEACRMRLRADVPVGAYLSGGLDSSTIAAVIRRFTTNELVTFSIAFADKQFDESDFQKRMARHLGTDHHVIRATHEDIGRVFPAVVWHTETPLMRTAPAPMFLLSKLVRNSGFKVVLTGEGADEFLGGYDIFKENKIRRFWAAQASSRRRPLLFQRLYGDIEGMRRASPEMLAAFFGEGLHEIDSPWYSHAVRWRNNKRTLRFFHPDALSHDAPGLKAFRETFPDHFNAWSPMGRAQCIETKLLLSQYLLSSQGDRMGMAHSIEGRFPFLDVRLVEFCNRLPARWKLKGLTEKYLLKKAASPWLPDIISQRPKRPYRAPVHRSLFNDGTKDYVKDILSPAALNRAGIFQPQPVAALIRKIETGASLGETDDMAMAGIISTQLCHEQFITHFQRAQPVGESDRVKLCRLDASEHLSNAIH
jgi:asparagine synthase (glutamine-hydrolysing)